MADERVHPLLAVDGELIRRVAREAFGSEPVKTAEPMTGGLSHTLFDVSLADGSRWVFRFCAGGVDRFERERRLLPQLAKHLPVPALHWAGIVGHPVLVLGFIEGVPLWKVRREQPGCLDVLAAPLARLLATVARCGITAAPPLPEATVKSSDEPLALTLERLSSPRVRERAGADLCERLAATYQTDADALTQLGPKGLCHGDLSLRNILLRPSGSAWELAALIDWDEPFDASPLWDVGHLFRYRHRYAPEFRERFERAYRNEGGALPGGWWHTARLLDAMRFIDTLFRPREQPQVFAELRELLDDLTR